MPMLEAVTALAERPDHWAAANTHCLAHYQLVADAQPAVLCQVLNLLAMQYLVPQQVQVQNIDGELHIELQVDGLSGHRAQVIGEKMRNLIDVHSVELQPMQAAMPRPVLATA